jgi:Arc/MetJ-type ribon-helix-helix transcriptional regulator
MTLTFRTHASAFSRSFVNNTDNGYITRMPVNPDRMTRKLVSIPNELLRTIDDFRFRRRIRTESEAIRRLIERRLGKAKPSRRTVKKPRSTGKSAGLAR